MQECTSCNGKRVRWRGSGIASDGSIRTGRIAGIETTGESHWSETVADCSGISAVALTVLAAKENLGLSKFIRHQTQAPHLWGYFLRTKPEVSRNQKISPENIGGDFDDA